MRFVLLGRAVRVSCLGTAPHRFRVSMASIFLNAVLGLCFLRKFRRTGSSSGNRGRNLFSMLLLFWLLDRKLNGLLAVGFAHRFDWVAACSRSRQLGYSGAIDIWE